MLVYQRVSGWLQRSFIVLGVCPLFAESQSVPDERSRWRNIDVASQIEMLWDHEESKPKPYDRKHPCVFQQLLNFDLNCPQIDSAERGGSHNSSSSSPQRKHAMNTERKGPTGTNDSMASGGQGAQTTPKVQTASDRKKKPRGKDPNQPSQSPRRQGNPFSVVLFLFSLSFHKLLVSLGY